MEIVRKNSTKRLPVQEIVVLLRTQIKRKESDEKRHSPQELSSGCFQRYVKRRDLYVALDHQHQGNHQVGRRQRISSGEIGNLQCVTSLLHR